MKTVPVKPDLNNLVEKAAEQAAADKAPEKNAAETAGQVATPAAEDKKPGHYGPIILFNILMLPVFILVIAGHVNAYGSDLTTIITIVWWAAFVGINIVLIGQRRIRMMLEDRAREGREL